MVIKTEKEWQAREKELSADEKEYAWKQQQLSRGPKKGRRKLEQALEAELHALKKERRRMNKEKEEIQRRRLQAEKEKAEVFALPLFGDATRRLDIFWWLDHNDQMKWAEKHLRVLQKLDPNNALETALLPIKFDQE
ncbi:hypothetical protein VM1G_10405 [Cytospora mali]|uniref:Uncharacterized protein n=1 Tax=Cytospora mali TaxID=578113 RepID=A0A194VHG6_CYTMA|nr:hypothetical protein VM1G_10405 [Valsa mali]